MEFKVAIVGRANVGKTSIFNCLVGKKIAITHNTPGITRDRKEATTNLGDIYFRICDTAGLENAKNAIDLQSKMNQQSLFAVEEAHLCLFVIDGREGVEDRDKEFFKIIRKQEKPFILIVNKAENHKKLQNLEDLFYFNSTPVYISAEHRLGLDDLYVAMLPFYKSHLSLYPPKETQDNPVNNSNAIKVAIVGRPNAGKSTLINNLLQQNRLVTDNMAGTTRDTISIDFEYDGQMYQIMDTAGVRRKSSIENELEKMSVQESLRAIDFADIVVLLIDISGSMDHQDMSLIGYAKKEGRPTIVVFNKWDLVGEKNRNNKIKKLSNIISQSGLSGAIPSFITISALNDLGSVKIFKEILELYHKYSSTTSTSKLNKWLIERGKLLRLPKIKGRSIKLKFITQYTSKPPSFMISTNFADVPEQTMDTIKNDLIDYFGLQSIPIRMLLKKSHNPFVNKEDNANNTVTKKRYKG